MATHRKGQPETLFVSFENKVGFPQHWHWSPVELAALDQGAEAIGDVVMGRLAAAGLTVDISGDNGAYAFIHDRDLSRSVVNGKVVDVPEQPGFHFFAKLVDGQQQTYQNLADIIGVNEPQVDHVKPGRYTRDNKLSYLCHVKYAALGKIGWSRDEKTGRLVGRYGYDPAEVVTLAGRPYIDIAAERWTAWVRGRRPERDPSGQTPLAV